MKRVFRGILFCPLNRGEVRRSRKGGASAASQSAECVSSYMTHNDNPVTLTSCSSPVRAIPQPSGPKAPSNLRTFRPIGPVNPKNPRGAAPSTLTPKACPKSYHIISPSTSWPSRGRVLVNCQSRAPGWLQVLPHWAHQRGVDSGREGRWIFSSSQE